MSPSKKVNARKSVKRTTTQREKKKRKEIAVPELSKVQEEKVVENQQPVATKNNWLSNTLRVLSILAVIGITVYIYSIRDHAREFAAFGYPGIFLIALMANATVFLPAPGVAVVFTMGSIFNPLGVALAAGTGGALGELTGYLAGFSGQAVVENTKMYQRFLPWVQKYGAWAILVLAAIPNPFFDLAGIAAGVTKIPLWRFLLFCWIGQIIKMAMFAYAGAYSIGWLIKLFH